MSNGLLAKKTVNPIHASTLEGKHLETGQITGQQPDRIAKYKTYKLDTRIELVRKVLVRMIYIRLWTGDCHTPSNICIHKTEAVT